MQASLDADLTAYFKGDLKLTAWPYPLYARMQALHGGMAEWSSGPALLLTKYEDVKDAMAKKLPLHNDGYRYGALAEGVLSRLPSDCQEVFFKVFDFETLYMTRNDGERHQRIRAAVHRAFLPRNIETLRSSIQRHVDELIDEMASSNAPDWKIHVAEKLPVRVICDLFGVPQTERERLWQFAETIAAHFSMTADTLRQAAVALEEFGSFVRVLIDGVRRTGEGTELSKSLIEAVDAGALSEEELVAMYLVVLFGGAETTTNLLGNGFYALQRFRSQWELLVESPDKIRGALEELLRYDNSLQYLPRVATQNFELHGRTVARNETVILMIGAANWDAEVFAQPDELRLDRANSSKHLGFAYGPHFCIGAALARMEGELAFASLIRRFPQVRLTRQDVSHRGSAMLRAITSLPVDLNGAAAA
jgi:cytochrome P450